MTRTDKLELLKMFKGADKILKSHQNWGKGDYYCKGRYCLTGAMAAGQLGKASRWDNIINFWDNQKFYRVGEWFRYHFPQLDVNHITIYNDDKKTSFKDIKKLIKESIRILKLQTAA